MAGFFQFIDLDSIISIAISLVALIISIITYNRTRSFEKYNFSDQRLHDLLEISLNNAKFCDPEFTNNYNSKKVKIDPEYQRYDVYAMMIWNYLQVLFDYYGKRSILSDRNPCSGVVEYWSILHSRWYFEEGNREYYDDYFEKIIKKQAG